MPFFVYSSRLTEISVVAQIACTVMIVSNARMQAEAGYK